MRLVNQRLLARALLQCFLGTVFFCLGVLYHQSQNCSLRAQMHPDHYGNPELVDAWNDGLKHKETFLLIVILSSPQNEERRNVIRETWANVAKQHRDKFLLYFWPESGCYYYCLGGCYWDIRCCGTSCLLSYPSWLLSSCTSILRDISTKLKR